ncbi:hypothetical protein [Fimbriiglobus ruber]|uniref:Type II/IV secretion system ATP hydrolase TadA/VirB11/CpaF, TadA subfamily n=1 Tax=Fimbriiglobus ruber TaxID=1908690 RepID=A0A225E0C1_9BACT|nr:hypothetical protein [Fimbriiglobus ruber]OWK42939.1 Type II/IV secretion system ATP hydrolase TadA/VirB11/CpaF, TadA subfamily [Fimbriiglobus ruber]
MTPSAPGFPHTAQSIQSAARATTPAADLRRKAHARLAERIDPFRSRFKPLSLVRQEAKRVLEQFLDAEHPILTRGERDRLIEEVLGEALGFGPLEELFRDEAVKEILVLAPGQIIIRKGDAWQPTSVRFRDADHMRTALAKLVETGESLVPGPAPTGGFDVKLQNGFRALAVTPPGIMDLLPIALFVRGTAAPASGLPAPTNGGSGTVQLGQAALPTVGIDSPHAAAGTDGPRSGSVPAAAPASGRYPRPNPYPVPGTEAPAQTPTGKTQLSSRMVHPLPRGTGEPSAPPATDLYARDRQRITQKIISKFAAAGLYDLNQIPLPELRRIIQASVLEYCAGDRLDMDESTKDRLALEILAGMNR